MIFENAKNPVAAQSLASLMSDISEDRYCAGWMAGIEFELWKAVLALPEVAGNAEMLPYMDERIASLKELSDECGGWIHWPNTGNDQVFVPLDEWQKIYVPDTQEKSKRLADSSPAATEGLSQAAAQRLDNLAVSVREFSRLVQSGEIQMPRSAG